MSYRTLAQKYRPQFFEDVMGQESVTRTLKNSISRGRIANAYIFCGPRGVGKTSIARLLSKTLNCEASPEERPCNKCDSCMGISGGSNIDVLEIDGASNRGIDEIRTLRDNVKFSPSKGKYKVYIIDEVHMLTQEAFNALLKTLEEPPAHVKFIFATTEPHKVLATIMSRCQRFDFKRIPPSMMYERIKLISGKENIALEDKAALMIARAADGSLRDALVILDQMISFSGERVTSEDVVELLGMVHRDKLVELAWAIVKCDTSLVAGLLDELINSGKDPVFINNSLIAHFRDIMVLKTAGKPTSDMVFAGEELAELNSQAKNVSLEEILYILQNLTNCLGQMKGSLFARAPLEICLVRLTRRKLALSIPGMLKKIRSISPTESSAGKTPPGRTEQNVQGRSTVATPGEDKVSFDKKSDAPPEQAAFSSDGTFNWKAVLNHVRNRKVSLHAFLVPARPLEVTGSRVVIGFPREYSFNAEAMDTRGNRDVLEEAVKRVTGKEASLEFKVMDLEPGQVEEISDQEKKKAREKEEMKPVVEKAMDVFGGHVLRDYEGGR